MHIRKALFQHFVVFTGLVLGAWLIVFILGQFNELHPNAARDGVMSVVYVYVVIFVVHLLFLFFKQGRFVLLKTWLIRLDAWDKQSSVFTHIAVLFTLITFINSVMMLTGIDTPKSGTFAYTHLLTRLLIVTIAGLLWQHQKVLHFFQKSSQRNAVSFKHTLTDRFATFSRSPFNASASLFTTITVTGCVVMVGLSRFIQPQGGTRLYASLLVLYGVSLLLCVLLSHKKRPRQVVS